MPKVKDMSEKLWKQKVFHCGDRHLAQIEELLELTDQPNFTRLMHHCLEVTHAYYTGQITLDAQTTEEVKALYLHRIEQTRQEFLRLQALAVNPKATSTVKKKALGDLKVIEQVLTVMQKTMKLEMEARNVLDAKTQAEMNIKRDNQDLAERKHQFDKTVKVIELEERR